MLEHANEWPRYARRIERVDEQARVTDLPAVGAPHEASQLRFDSPPAPRGLLLEGAEGSEVALGVDDGFDGGGAETADQLVFQIRDADVEAEAFHLGPREARAETRIFKSAPEDGLFACIAQSGDREAGALGSEVCEELSDAVGTADRKDPHALGSKVRTAARRQRLEGDLVAHSFDGDDGLDSRDLQRRCHLRKANGLAPVSCLAQRLRSSSFQMDGDGDGERRKAFG
jgi:hypothetical protein